MVSTSDDSVVNLNDLNLGTSLTSDYEELMFSYPVLNRVIEKLKLDMDYEDLAKLYTLNNPSVRVCSRSQQQQQILSYLWTLQRQWQRKLFPICRIQ